MTDTHDKKTTTWTATVLAAPQPGQRLIRFEETSPHKAFLEIGSRIRLELIDELESAHPATEES